MKPVIVCFVMLFAVARTGGPALAGDDGLAPGGTGTVRAVVDGDTLELDSGDQVRLVGIQAPKLPLGRKDFLAWPLAEEAKAALETMTLGKELTLSYGGRRVDRHRRLLAHLHDADGRWIQGELLARGLARVYSFADNRARVAEMLRLEGAARAEGRGIWGAETAIRNFYAIRETTETPQFLHSFQLVQGRVRRVATVRGKTYLNFGDDWRADFTVTIPSDARRRFKKAGIDPAGFEGRWIRVRGWLKSFNGPMILATHPEQIEFPIR